MLISDFTKHYYLGTHVAYRMVKTSLFLIVQKYFDQFSASFLSKREYRVLRLSNYTTVLPLKSTGEYLLYNTFTDTVVCIQDEQSKIFGKKEWDPNTLSEDKDTFQELQNLGFLVKDEVNETGIVKKALWDWRLDTEVLDIKILPTYWCNLNCSYCYQKKFSRTQTMNEKTCEQMLCWIQRKLKDYRSRKLIIKFFGGEILGKINLLENLCDKIKSISIENEIELGFDLTTNGTLLSTVHVRKLNIWGINTVKITIDGDETTHNLRRPFLNGKGSFQKIIKNIINQSDKLDIILRCNFNRHNLKNIPRLLDYLAENKLNIRLKHIEFQPVLNKEDFSQSDTDQNCNKSVFTDQQINQLLWVNKQALKRGFQVNTELTGGRCPAFFKSSFLIDPIGDIYKCPAFLGNRQNSIGTVFDNSLNYQNETFLMDDSWSSCLECKFVPICCGGCRYAAKERFGDFLGKKICEKEYFEKAGLKILKLVHEQQAEQEELQFVEQVN